MDKWLNLDKSDGEANNKPVNSSQTKQRTRKQIIYLRKRKYDESFLQFGFTFQNCKGREQPLCLICNELLASKSMKPSKLKRHFKSKHVLYVNKPIKYFEKLCTSLKEEKKSIEKFISVNEKYLLASYEVSYFIAKSKRLFTIGEDLVLPAAIKMVEILHGSKYGDNIPKIPLSKDTVANRISFINKDQLMHFLQELNKARNFQSN